jgi:hypothetical protein
MVVIGGFTESGGSTLCVGRHTSLPLWPVVTILLPETFAGAAALVTASQHFRLHDFTVILQNDCQPALAALRKGSYCSPILQDIAIEHAEFCMQLGINAPLTLFAPGNSLIAEGIDCLSRDAVRAAYQFESSPVLRDLVQSVARDQGWTLTIDLFANSENSLLPRFFSRLPDRFSEGVDALSQPSWRRSSCPHCRNCHMPTLSQLCSSSHNLDCGLWYCEKPRPTAQEGSWWPHSLSLAPSGLRSWRHPSLDQLPAIVAS